MTSDYYSILGVSPAAEDVVIRAAYLALIRHYHPDSNPDPAAQERAREITAAFAVLRDPVKRAEYDSIRGAPRLWKSDEIRIPPDLPRPPAMRGMALASAALALALVVAVSVRPQPNPPPSHEMVIPERHAPAARAGPAIELEPESVRLARLREESEADAPPPQPLTRLDEGSPLEASLAPAIPIASAMPARPAPQRAARGPMRSRTVAAAVSPETRPAAAFPEASAGCTPGGSVAVSAGCKNARLTTLDRIAAGFFSQSMAHADPAKRRLLLSAHNRSAETRLACRSDSCVTDAYLRQMREISAIMEARDRPAQ